MSSRQDTIDAGNGQTFEAYVSLPDRPSGRAIVVVQEIFGVTRHIKAVADRYAEAGYLAIAPDLFWRVEPGIALSHSKEDIARAFEILHAFDEDQAVTDLAATIGHARAQEGIEDVALMGMCLGGKLAYLTAARLPVAASLAFYGVGIEKNLPEAGRIDTPLLMFFGAKDKYVPEPVRGEIMAALAGNEDVTIEVVPDADHGFYTRGDPAVIERTHAQALAFLDQHMA